MHDQAGQRWLWVFLSLQFLGYVFDAIWHGMLSGGVEPETARQMFRHLSTVHLPLYVGIASALIVTATALVRDIRRPELGIGVPVAFAGSLLSAGAEAWQAYSHLGRPADAVPVVGIVSFVGFLVVVAVRQAAATARHRHDQR